MENRLPTTSGEDWAGGASKVAPVAEHVRSRRFARLLREPLLHFIVAGVALFAAYHVLHQGQGRRDDGNRIVLNADDVRQLETAWIAQWQRAPTPGEMRGLVDTRLREEILYREALALGLDKNDTIVKRRLAQKMEFVADDVSSVADPSRATLLSWHAQNPERFRQAGRISFRHVYFSVDTRHEQARSDAAHALEKLGAGPGAVASAAKAGDPFMFQDSYNDRSHDEVASVLGTQFAESVFQLKPGAWQGPVESGLGWHVVFVETATLGRLPAFEEIEAQVKSEWIAQQRAEARGRAFDAMKERYQITVADMAAGRAPFVGAAGSKAAP